MTLTSSTESTINWSGRFKSAMASLEKRLKNRLTNGTQLSPTKPTWTRDARPAKTVQETNTEREPRYRLPLFLSGVTKRGGRAPQILPMGTTHRDDKHCRPRRRLCMFSRGAKKLRRMLALQVRQRGPCAKNDDRSTPLVGRRGRTIIRAAVRRLSIRRRLV